MVKGKNVYIFNLFWSENVILAYLTACIIIILNGLRMDDL